MTLPDLSDDNLLLLDQLEIQITLSEIQEKTLAGFIHWTILDTNNMTTRFGEFDLYLSVLNGQGDSHLDVLRNGVNEFTAQSVVHPEVTDILNTVRDLAASPDFYDELITRAYKGYRRCPTFDRGTGGVEVGGRAEPFVVVLAKGGIVVNGASNNHFTNYSYGGAMGGGNSPTS